MKRRDLIRSAAALGMTALAACSPAPPVPSTVAPSDVGSAPGVGRPLLAWFSRAGENYYNGGRIDLDVGNTEVVANLIADAIAVDRYRIEPAEPYPHSYDATVARNVREEQSNARPALARPMPDLTGHPTILLGCPVWNAQGPMIMRTFLDGLDLKGTTIHPFVTYAGHAWESRAKSTSANLKERRSPTPL